MKTATILLWVTIALFVLFGLGFIFAPAFFAQLLTESVPDTPSGRIDLRATYGGLSLGAAIYWAWCAREKTRVQSGLLSALSLLTVTALARIFGMIVEGSPNIFMVLLLAAEVLFVGLLFWAIKKTTP